MVLTILQEIVFHLVIACVCMYLNAPVNENDGIF